VGASRDPKAIVTACGLLLILPALSLLYYVSVFGVNVIVLDEWDVVPLLQKMMNGTLSFSDLFAQHSEHRILFPRVAMLVMARLTQYNTVVEMLFSWVLVCLTGVFIFWVYRRKFSCESPRLLLMFLPVSLLLFNFKQYESILWGVTCQIYLMVFGAVATFSLLEKSERMDIWFVLCLASATVSSFSFLTGLLVWPVGFLQVVSSRKEKILRRLVLWCLVGTTVFVSYFCCYVKPSIHPPLNYVLENPVTAIRHFLALLGAVFSFDITMAIAFGLATVLIALFVMAQMCRERILRRSEIWLSLILFAVLSSVATTVGRAGFGVEQALSSRYTPITALGVAGLYLLALSVSEKLPPKSKSFGVHALIALILVGLVVSYQVGWQEGQSWRGSRETGAYVLRTYKIQSDENIRNFLYPIPGASSRIKEIAQFLEQKKLNVFSEPVIDTSTLILSGSNTFFALDTINTHVAPEHTTLYVINSSQQETIMVTGWAVDKQVNDVASAVFITIDGSIDIPCLYGRDRQDVAEAYRNSKFRLSGFVATFGSSILSKGKHTISLKIVSKDRIHFYQPEQTYYVLVI